MEKKQTSVLFLAQAGLIAALYVVLTYLANALGVGSMAIQFRFSEILTILPVFTPAAIPGLAVGCLLGNLSSPLGPVDWVFGTSATLLGAVLAYLLRHVRWKGLPVLSSLMPVLCNAVVVSFEITCLSSANQFSLANFGFGVFLLNAVTVAIGEVVMCMVLGLLLYHVLQKSHAAQHLFPVH